MDDDRIDIGLNNFIAQGIDDGRESRGHLAKRINITGRLSAHAIEKYAQLQTIDEPPRVCAIKWWQCEYGIPHNFGVYTADADNNYRSELRIALDAKKLEADTASNDNIARCSPR